MVFYNPDDTERPRKASDRSYFLPTASTPEITRRIFRGASISPGPVKRVSPRSILRRRLARRERDLRVALPPPPSHARTQLPNLTPGIPPVGWEQTQGVPPNEVSLAEDLQPALDQLHGRREQEDWDREGAGGASGDMSENEGGILLIREGEAGGCVRVQNRCHRRRVVVARDSEGWGALDEKLSDVG